MFESRRRRGDVVLYALVLVVSVAGCVERSAQEIIVPDVIGLSLDDAYSALTDADLLVDTPSLQHSDTVPKDHVIAQTPDAGDTAPREFPVSLVVSMGPSQLLQDAPSDTNTETDSSAGQSLSGTPSTN